MCTLGPVGCPCSKWGIPAFLMAHHDKGNSYHLAYELRIEFEQPREQSQFMRHGLDSPAPWSSSPLPHCSPHPRNSSPEASKHPGQPKARTCRQGRKGSSIRNCAFWRKGRPFTLVSRDGHRMENINGSKLPHSHMNTSWPGSNEAAHCSIGLLQPREPRPTGLTLKSELCLAQVN